MFECGGLAVEVIGRLGPNWRRWRVVRCSLGLRSLHL